MIVMKPSAVVHWRTAAALIALSIPSLGQWGWTALVSRSESGGAANGPSAQAAPSFDGRFVAFSSGASDLVSADTNGAQDVFVRDMWTAAIWRVSVSSTGEQANGPSGSDKCAISGDGRFAVFSSTASNLVADDTNGVSDVFVHDLFDATTRRVSVGPGGQQLFGASDDATISLDGRYVAFDSVDDALWPLDTNAKSDVFVVDLVSGGVTCASVNASGAPSNGESTRAAISDDGRWAAFSSSGDDLVGGDTNATWDTFLRDFATSQTWRVSVSSSGAQGDGPSNSVRIAVSGDGRFVTFLSLATNLVDGDTNGFQDAFVHDHSSGMTERVSTDSYGGQSNDASAGCSMSSDGRFATFGSYASNLVDADTNGATDVFVKDRWTGRTMRVSLDDAEQQGDGASTNARISGDGRVVVFQSTATNLVPGDANGFSDVFQRDWQFQCDSNVLTYCVAMVNSVGQTAQIGWEGTNSMGANDFALTVTGCPPGRNGIFFFGKYETMIPFGEGVLCVTGEQQRLPIVHLDGAGVGRYALDFNDPLSAASHITPATYWNFQFWYRDPQTVGHGFNLSNALRTSFCP
jgi:hypothetical protein